MGRIRKPGATTGDISLDIAHRMGKLTQDAKRPRPIVLKLVDRHSKDQILRFCKNLKGSPISIADQFPDVVRARRAALVPELKKQRGLGQQAHIRVDKLYINGKPAENHETRNGADPTLMTEPLPALMKSVHTQQVRSNKFAAVAVKVFSQQDVTAATKQLLLVPDAASASHIMYSYRLGEVTGYDVDGEFGAHVPLFKALQAHDNTLVAVLHWTGLNLGPQRLPVIQDIATSAIARLASE